MRCAFLGVWSLALCMSFPMGIRADTVAHWRFEEGLPDTVASGTDSVLDSSGNALDGTPVLGPIYRSVLDVLGSTLALEFDTGNAANRMRVFVPDSPLFELTQNLSIEAFILSDGIPATTSFFAQILFRGDDRAGLDPYFLALDVSGRLVLQVQNASGSFARVVSPFPVPTGQFVHVAGTLNDLTNELKVFIEGVEVASKFTSIRPLASLNPSFAPGVAIGDIQSSVLPFNEAFDGLIDEVRLSDVALFPEEFLINQQPSIDALIDIDPDTLNLRRRGRWITANVTLPEGFDPADIDTDSLMISDLDGVGCPADYTQLLDPRSEPRVGDRDEDGVADLTVKFDLHVLLPNLCLDDVTLTVTGELTTGETFSGSDQIRVIHRGR